MGVNLVNIKVHPTDKRILQVFIKEDYLEKNPNVSKVSINNLFNFLLTEYLGINYNLLRSKIENEHNNKPRQCDRI